MADENQPTNEPGFKPELNYAQPDGGNLHPNADAETATALDALADAARKEITGGDDDAGNKPAADAPKVDDVQPKADDVQSKPDDAAPKADDVQPKADDAQPKPDDVKPKADDFETIELPPHTKPKTAEAFATVKEKARQQITALRDESAKKDSTIADLNKQLEEAKKNQGQITPEVKTELDDLRKFKLAHDVTSDPEFQRFDKSITTNNDAVLKKLKEVGAADDVVSRIKELGIDNVNWESILPKVPLQARRYIEAKLVENETLREDRESALTNAKANAEQFLAERNSRQTNLLNTTAESYFKNFGFGAVKAVPPDAKPEEKAAIEAENKANAEHASRVRDYLANYGPETYAQLAVGTARAFQLQGQLQGLTAKYGEQQKALEAVKKERDGLQAKLDGIKKAAAPNRPGEIRPAAPAKPKTDLNRDSGSVLDELAKAEEAKLTDE